LPELAVLAEDMGSVHVGGPVQPSAVVVLADFADAGDADSLVLESIGFLPAEVDPVALGELRRARVYVGYAGWGPGQLDGELEDGSWIVAMRAGGRASSTASSRTARGSSSLRLRRTSSRTIPKGSGAACSAGRAARSGCSPRCRPIPVRTD